MQFMRFSLALLFAANVQAEKDIVDTAVAAGKFGILAEALTKADLVYTLKGTGPFTVFAPTDDAFAAALKALKITKEQLLARADLKSILLYHVVSGSVKSTGLSDGMTPATVQGTNLKVSISGDVVKVNTAKVTSADVMCSNGVIHIIDKVLLPPDIVDTAVADGRFTILAEALTKANLVDALKGTGPFTVFAPTDDAFAAALVALKTTKEKLLARKDLKSILLYHVVGGYAVKSTGLSDGMTPETMIGSNLKVSISGGVVKVNTAKVTSADVMCGNGVIHIIDKVLLPPDIVDTAVTAGKFTILAEALTKANLVDTLKGTGPFTVFAPTDDAFAAALKALKITKEQLLARTDLKSILLYHVVSGSVKSTDLSNGMNAKTVQGCDVKITIDGAMVKVNDAKVTKADVIAGNGVIHIMDAVMLPPTDACGTVTTTKAGNAVASAAYIAQGSFAFGAILTAFLFP